MSGPRGFRDLDREREERERQRLINRENRPVRQYPIMGYGFELGTPDSARKESFWQMIKYIFCPFFTVMSFIFAITCVQIVIYFITVFYDYDEDAFLEPKDGTLDDFGAKNPEKMQQDYQIWRFITPMFLHADMTHIIFNLFIQLILGFRLEPTVGIWRTMVVYVLSAIGGVLFSSVVDPLNLAVGASTAIFGIIAAMITWIIMNWSSLENDSYRTVTLIWLIILLLFNFLIGFATDLVDNWGHLGGMITGFALGLVFFEFIDPPSKAGKTCQIVAAALLGVYYIGGIVLFYTVVET